MDSPLEPPERNTALPTLDFSPMRRVLDSHLQSCKIINEYFFKPLKTCGHLLQQQQDTNTVTLQDLMELHRSQSPCFCTFQGGTPASHLGTVRTMGRSKTQVISSGWLTSALETLPTIHQPLLWEGGLVWNRVTVASTGLCLSWAICLLPSETTETIGQLTG